MRHLVILAAFAAACTRSPSSAPREALGTPTLGPALSLSRAVFETRSERPHSGGGYLAITIPWEPIRAFHARLSERVTCTLKTRGEAHITLLTPIEVQQGLGDASHWPSPSRKRRTSRPSPSRWFA